MTLDIDKRLTEMLRTHMPLAETMGIDAVEGSTRPRQSRPASLGHAPATCRTVRLSSVRF